MLHSRGEAVHLHRSFHKWASKEMVAAGTQVRRMEMMMMMLLLMVMMMMIDSGEPRDAGAGAGCGGGEP